MAKILIVYGTAYGHTKRIALRIGQVLLADHDVNVVQVDRLPAGLAPDVYDGVVVASSVLYGRYHRAVGAFVHRHVAHLNAVPTAFASVCGALAGSGPDAAATAQGYVDKFLGETGWRPEITRSFAGELAYTRYRPWIRWMMKAISGRTGRATDTSRDYDFTDWTAVEGFGRQFASLFAHPVGADSRKSDADEIC